MADLPWYTGMSKQQEEKSVRYHQERVKSYHQIHELCARKVDVASIARQVGMSRQRVYNYFQMKQPPERTRIHHPGRARLEPYKEYLIRRWRDYLARLCEADPQIHETYELIQEFTTVLREWQGERLDAWLARVKKQGVAELQGYAQGLQKDYEAVKAGLTLEWSNGQTEGQVHRLKLLKRQMYGRAASISCANEF